MTDKKKYYAPFCWPAIIVDLYGLRAMPGSTFHAGDGMAAELLLKMWDISMVLSPALQLFV
jgi:hypothetical protein